MSTSQNPMWNDPEVVANYRPVERVTRPAGELLIKQTGILSEKAAQLVVLDNACGTGVISRTLYEKLDPAQKANLELTCGDITSAFVECIENVIATEHWTGAKAEVIDAQVSALY